VEASLRRAGIDATKTDHDRGGGGLSLRPLTKKGACSRLAQSPPASRPNPEGSVAITSFAGALYRWLFRWNARARLGSAWRPVLSDTALSGCSGGDGGPAHVTLAAPVNLNIREQGTEKREARWLLAESSWASIFSPPRFLGVARWIWKVSTCLLVLQFVIPMRRHWQRARRADKSWHRRLSDRIMALCYLGLMAVAATVSVLLSLVLLALAVLEKLPIPRIDLAVRWVAVKISAVLGDSYMLAHCPVQFAAMCTQVASDLRWLQDRCEKVAVVAHSQGAAIAHQVLKDDSSKNDDGSGPDGVQAFITIGQGISKLHLLWRMDWDPHAYRAAWGSRLLVTTGMFLAGLPALGLLVRHWTSATIIKIVVRLPTAALLPCAGFVAIVIGVYVAMHAVCGDLEEDLALPGARFCWSDYYASADPVSNGPLVTGSGQTRRPEAAHEAGLPGSCNEVYNSASILFDHNRYLRNQDQLLSRLINDLAAAAYGVSPDSPKVVRDDDLIKVGRRRHRLVLSLIAARILSIGLVVGLWWLNLGPVLRDPANRLISLFAHDTAMSNGFARFVAAILIAAVAYVTIVMMWRIAEDYVMRRFFHTAKRADDAGQQDPLKPASRLGDKQTPVPVG
jgi:hypothetical protein